MAAGPTRTRELDASSFAPRMRTTFAQIAKDAGTSIKAVSGALRGGLTRTTEAYYARICAVDASRRWSERSSAPRHGSKRSRSASDRYRRNLHRPTDWNAVVRIRSNHRRCPHFGMSVLGMRVWSGVPRSPTSPPTEGGAPFTFGQPCWMQGRRGRRRTSVASASGPRRGTTRASGGYYLLELLACVWRYSSRRERRGFEAEPVPCPVEVSARNLVRSVVDLAREGLCLVNPLRNVGFAREPVH